MCRRSLIWNGSPVAFVEEGGVKVERIGEAVGGVDAHYESAVTAFGEFDTGGGGYAGFTDAAFTAEEKNTHVPNSGTSALAIPFAWHFNDGSKALLTWKIGTLSKRPGRFFILQT